MYHDTVNYPRKDTPISAATCADTYWCEVYDPEGTLGYLTATALTFFGLQAGRVLVHHKATSHAALVKRWIVWGLTLCVIGGALCEFKKEGGFMPISKNLWSPSFIAVMAGTGFLVLALTYVLVDVARLWQGGPFRFVGMNSIIGEGGRRSCASSGSTVYVFRFAWGFSLPAVYVFSEVLQYYIPFSFADHRPADNFNGGQFMTHTGALASNTLGVLTWCFIAWRFFKNGFFYKL